MKITYERVAVLAMVAIFALVPLSLVYYKTVYLQHKFKGARIITLTALAGDGVWTDEPVRGTNYWRKHFPSAPDIQVKEGEDVVLRLASADVLHSFAIPALDIGPFDVPAGEVREARFTARKPGTLMYLCWQVCSPLHEKLRGAIIVTGPNGELPGPAETSEPDL